MNEQDKIAVTKILQAAGKVVDESVLTECATVGTDGRVILLNLKKCDELKELPPEIGQLSQLKELDLGYCGNLTTLPPEIGQLEQLKELYLYGCKNLMTLPPEIGKLSRLKGLTLFFCSNLTTLPPEIGQLLELKELDLSGSENLTTLPVEIGLLSKLEKLDLSDCKALEKLPDSLLQLKELKSLELRGNKLQSFQVLGGGGQECWALALNDAQISRAQSNTQVANGPTRSPKFSAINQFMLVSRGFSGTLDLSNSSMSQLPDEISKLHKLTALDISNNDNLREVPPDLWMCGDLKEVNIKDCEYSSKLLGSLDSTLDSAHSEGRYYRPPKKVSWEDRPPYGPKLLIKFVTCAALLVMAIFTINELKPFNDESKNECIESCNELCVNFNLKYDKICQTCRITMCGEQDTKLSAFKYFVAVLSIILLLPHVVDVGNMMDQFLQVPFSGKIHEILKRQEQLAGRIDELTVWRYNVYGFLGSLADALCCFWWTRPWDVPNDVESDTNHSLERKFPEWITRIVDAPCKFFQFLFSKDRLPACLPSCILNLEWGRLWVIVVEWLDTVQTLSLIPLSLVVITSSSTVVDVLVNVVSVSVFAMLDDYTVEMFTKPRKSLLDRWRLYTGSEEDLRRSGKIKVERRTSADE